MSFLNSAWSWLSVPAHYAPLSGLAYSVVEYLLGKTPAGSFWGLLENAAKKALAPLAGK